jgi:hypothetical protein
MDEARVLVDLVKKIEQALAMVAEKTRKDKKLGLELQRAELHLKVSTKKDVKAGGKIEWGISIDLSASKEWSQAHTIVLNLAPKEKIQLGGKEESEELAETIFAVASAISELRKTVAGNFNASGAEVSIDVEESKDGKIQVVAGGGGKWTNAHTIKLGFRPSV